MKQQEYETAGLEVQQRINRGDETLMKNREKFAKEILDIACKGRNIAVTKDNKVVCCSNTPCELCMFDGCGKHIGRSQACADRFYEWAESEYVEKPTITLREKKFLDILLSNFKYIARDFSNDLYIYYNKPRRDPVNDSWTTDDSKYFYISIDMYGSMFDFIKWEDEKPWSIEDLKKLEVKDE